MVEPTTRITWEARILSVQPRAWVWRYKVDNRTHHHLGFNLFLKGRAGDKTGKFIVAISDSQHAKWGFRIGDEFRGTAWPCLKKKAKHDIADYYRAGGFKCVSRVEQDECQTKSGPPFTNLLPQIDTFAQRGARMLDAKLYRKTCFTCMWANKSAVEIEYDFGKTKRYRKETFWYGPKSCGLDDMGEPRPVQYVDDDIPYMDEGWLDEICAEGRGEED